MTIKYNPFDETLWKNPWPVYQQLRREDPVYFVEEYNAWALTRFEDIWKASMDRDSYTATHGTSLEALLLDPTMPPKVFLFMDHPEHRLHRGLIADKYTPQQMVALEQKVRETTRAVLEPGLAAGEMDIYQVSSDIALHTIAGLIGITFDEIKHIRRLIDCYFKRIPGHIGPTEEGLAALAESRLFIQELLQKYREAPLSEDSHITTWLQANINNQPLEQDVLIFNVTAMTITGSDTLPLTTAATVNYLAESPEQLAMVRKDHSLIPDAFAEAARFDQPTNILGRVLTKDIEIRDKTLKKGQVVLFLYASANRDESEFEDPDKFVIQRKPKRNLSFGTGLHFCLGQHLAKLEGKIILEELFSSIGDFEVDTAGRKRIFGEFLQGFCALPIRFSQ